MTQGEVLAQLGMDTAANAANPKFVVMARWWIEQWSAQRRSFTADDLLVALDSLNVSTRENRALGGVVRRAVNDGLIVATGRYIPSTRPESHARPCREWKGTGVPTDA